MGFARSGRIRLKSAAAVSGLYIGGGPPCAYLGGGWQDGRAWISDWAYRWCVLYSSICFPGDRGHVAAEHSAGQRQMGAGDDEGCSWMWVKSRHWGWCAWQHGFGEKAAESVCLQWHSCREGGVRTWEASSSRVCWCRHPCLVGWGGWLRKWARTPGALVAICQTMCW